MNLKTFLKLAEKKSVLNVVDENEALDLMLTNHGPELDGHEEVMVLLIELDGSGYISDFDEDAFWEVFEDTELYVTEE